MATILALKYFTENVFHLSFPKKAYFCSDFQFFVQSNKNPLQISLNPRGKDLNS